MSKSMNDLSCEALAINAMLKAKALCGIEAWGIRDVQLKDGIAQHLTLAMVDDDETRGANDVRNQPQARSKRADTVLEVISGGERKPVHPDTSAGDDARQPVSAAE